MAIGKRLPVPVADRLAKYYQLAMEKRREGVVVLSSSTIARELGLTCSTVRQDLSYVKSAHGAKGGYETQRLEQSLRQELVADRIVNVAIIGAGNMGRALIMHRRFSDCGFSIQAVFDKSPALIGRRIGGVKVLAGKGLVRGVRAKKIDIAVIAVPEKSAQSVADELVKAGVKGILNLSEGNIQAPEDVHVLDVRIAAGLLGLFCRMEAGRRQRVLARKIK